MGYLNVLNVVNVLGIVIIVQGVSLWNGKQLRLHVACESKGWHPLNKWHVLVCIIIDGILKCFECCECIGNCHYRSRVSLWNGKQLRLHVACESKGWHPLNKWHVLVCIIIDGIFKCFECCECVGNCQYRSRGVTMKRQATLVACCLWKQRVTSVEQVTCFGLHNYWWDIKVFWMLWMYWELSLSFKGCHYETASNLGCMLPVKAKGDIRWTSDMFWFA